MQDTNKSIYYFWVGNISGYLWSTNFNFKALPYQGERLKYLGWTSDLGWPKKLSTGRLLHKPNPKDLKKKRKARKRKLRQSSNN